MYIPVATGGCPAQLEGVGRTWWGWKDISKSSSCSELSNSSWDSITSSANGDGDLDLCVELLGLLAMFGLCIW